MCKLLDVHFLQIRYKLMTNDARLWWKLLPRALAAEDRSTRTENFKPSVTGEVLGENGRSYRRGCERRFGVKETFFASSNVTRLSLLPSGSTVTIFILVRAQEILCLL
jgi:hypothetical protein